jgi:aminopeptidase N
VPQDLLPPGFEFKDVMDTWILQSGYPVVTFERLYDDKKRAIVQQVGKTHSYFFYNYFAYRSDF